ncbi:hypothetical protein ACPB9J_13740 [Streptomyces lavendulocolor]|uniref:hypothetical protein n=1 Tax=Streptomyces lavendulocolor TaxID=67316 RepID=UPI003C2B3C9B
MVALVIGLGVAILYEYSNSRPTGSDSGSCWQPSISAYYYTPVQLFFVGALVAIGVSLIALKGSTELEDVFLNFAGILAPVVAFVPTPNFGGRCGPILTDTTNQAHNISNNINALLFMAAFAFVVLGVLKLLGRPVTGVPVPGTHVNEASAHRIAVVGYAAAFGLFVVAAVVFYVNREWFNGKAHWIAAVTMFVFIWFVVASNAVNFFFTRAKIVADQTASGGAGEAKPARPVNRYAVIAILMPAAALIILLVPFFGGYRAIWLEATMITLFAYFWIIQTLELWNQGLRTPDAGVRPTVTLAPGRR